MIDFTWRVGVFLLILGVLLFWQWRLPRSPLLLWRQRWRHNMALLVMGALCVRLVQPLLLSFVAWLSQGGGVLSGLGLPSWGSFLLALLLLDCLVYWQHRLFHCVPWLWRVHRVHHSDPELDVSSALRFHPAEILLSLVIKAVAVWLMGIPVAAVLVFDILLNGSAMFNHTNVRLPARLERWVNKWLVTPDMHRIHHSRLAAQANSNYGFCLSIWDTLFASRTWQASQGDEGLAIGMPNTRTYRPESLLALLMMPFKYFKKSP